MSSRNLKINGLISRPKLRSTPMVQLDFRWAWLALAAILFSLPFIREGDYSILASAIAATAACLLAMASAGNNLTSLVSIVALTHLLFYSLPAWGNLLLPKPVVRWDLWVSTDLAMWGCTLGILALALGSFIAGRLARPSRKSFLGSRTFPLPSFKFNLLLVSLIVPICLIQLALGVYYHSAIADYKLENRFYMNLISLAAYVSYSGIFLQTFRYFRTRLARDGYWAIAFSLFSIIIFLPSGNRGAAFGFLPLLTLAYLSWDPNTFRKIMALLSITVLTIAFTYGIGEYRGLKNVDLLSFNQKLGASLESPLAFYAKEGQVKFVLAAVILRFSDYVAPGRIIAYTPDEIPYRGFEQLDNLWQIIVPGFLECSAYAHKFN